MAQLHFSGGRLGDFRKDESVDNYSFNTRHVSTFASKPKYTESSTMMNKKFNKYFDTEEIRTGKKNLQIIRTILLSFQFRISTVISFFSNIHMESFVIRTIRDHIEFSSTKSEGSMTRRLRQTCTHTHPKDSSKYSSRNTTHTHSTQQHQREWTIRNFEVVFLFY